MINIMDVSIVIDSEYLENIKKKSEQKVVNIFFIVYLLFFIVSCLLVIFTNHKPFFILIFFPYMWILGPRIDGCDKKTIILLKNKYVKLSFLFSLIFFSSVIIVNKFLL